jgi:hypothetical protein
LEHFNKNFNLMPQEKGISKTFSTLSLQVEWNWKLTNMQIQHDYYQMVNPIQVGNLL